MIAQFGIKKEGPTGRVKVDTSGYYMARRLDSDSEYTPQVEDSEIIQAQPQVSAVGNSNDTIRMKHANSQLARSKLTDKTHSAKAADGINETQGRKSSNLRVSGSADSDNPA